MSTIKNQRCFTEATASARLILATGLDSPQNKNIKIRPRFLHLWAAHSFHNDDNDGL